MTLFSKAEWEAIATEALTSSVPSGNVQAFQEAFRVAAAKAEQAWHSAYEQSVDGQKRRGLQYDKVAFNPYYKMNEYWPDVIMVHQRKAGKNQTLCGAHFEMNIPFRLVEESGRDCLKNCGVCGQLGMSTFKPDAVLWVSKAKRPAKI